MSAGSRSSFKVDKVASVDEAVANEYEEEAVPESALQDNLSFASVFAGRHTAAPELVIGPQFVLGGASFANMLVGLLVGNALAVLAWRFVCAPIAVSQRFSTYYQVKRVMGNLPLAIYNVFVALVLGGIAGFMYVLASNALSIGFGIVDPSAASQFVLTNPMELLITFLTGTFTTVVAMFGFKFVTFVSYWLTPPMFLVIGWLIFQACADLNIGLGNFYEQMDTVVFAGPGVGQSVQFTLFIVILTAFVQDQFVHIGLVDLTLFRFAKNASAGWQSAWGMYLGHFVLWIGAGILFRSQQVHNQNTCAPACSVDAIIPGPMAQRLAGWPGLITILFASWSTANPFLYAGGLGLKSCFSIFGSDVSSRTVIGVMGVIATFVAFFPGIVSYFLIFVQIAGSVLVPVGAIIIADIYLLPRFNVQSEWSFKQSADCQAINLPAVIAWFVVSVPVAPLIYFGYMPGPYGPFLTFPIPLVLYTVLSTMMNKQPVDIGGDVALTNEMGS